MFRHFKICLISTIALLSLVITTMPTVMAAQSAAPKIAFVSDRDGNQEIYMMDGDGSNATNLTNNKADDFAPTWSPDGKNILFVTKRDGNQEIYVMQTDGSNPTNLTNNKADDFAPAWSPDGKNIMFRSGREDGVPVFVMQTDGSKPSQLTKSGMIGAPVWSPDGKHIAYALLDGRVDMNGSGIAFSGGKAGCYVMDADGSNAAQLTDNYILLTGPIWSPDSKQIAILSVSAEDVGYYLIDVDDKQRRKLDTELIPYNPSWSPDGAKIVFGTSEMKLIDVKSGKQNPLTDTVFTFNIVQKAFAAFVDGASLFDLSGVPNRPVWSSDGKQILFTSEDGAKADIYLISADGSNLINLSNNPATDTNAVFQPLPATK